MIVFRTVKISELIKLMLGKVIEGKIQKSPNCYEVIDGKATSMQENNKACFCAFLEPLFYNGNEYGNIMLQLDIPEDQITYGYGDYYSPIYNDYLVGDPWHVYGEFGPNSKFRGLLKTRVREVHFSQYDISNVLKVYFPYYIKISTELGYVEKNNDNPFCLGEFIHSYFIHLKKVCRKEHLLQYTPTYKYLDCLPFDLSISTTKKIIKKELLTNETLQMCNFPISDIVRVVDNFNFYSGMDFSAKLEKPSTFNYMHRKIDYRTLVYLLEETFEEKGNVFCLEIKDLPNFDVDDKRFSKIFLEFFAFAHQYQELWPLFLKNDKKIKNLLYALCRDYCLI